MSADIITAEKLQTVYDNSEKVKDLNTELESILYGADTGGKSWYDMFWDNFQLNGTRASYYNAFYGSGWSDEIFKPKYDIRPTNAYAMFNNSKITDLVAIAEQCGIVIDFSDNTNFTTTFAQSSIKRIGVVDTRSADTIQQTFYNSQQIQSIEKVILKDDGSQTLTNPFNWNYALEEIRFEGAIGGSMTVGHATKLSKASIENIVSCLSDTTSGKTLTLSKTAVNTIYGDTSNAEWLTLIATKPNWTISIG